MMTTTHPGPHHRLTPGGGPVIALPISESLLTRPHDPTEELVEAIYVGADGALADLYRLKLELDGYGVTLASTGTEGLARARKRPPDIMFIDLGAGDDSLLQTHRLLRRDPDLKDIPAVLLWRGETDAPTIKSLGLGVMDFLVKANGANTAHAWPDVTNGRIPFGYVQ